MKNLPYGHQHIDRDDIAAVSSALRSAWLTQGPKPAEFEAALCRSTGARYAVAVSSGTAALHVACCAAGLKPGDELVTSPITFVASANCALYCGAKPAFADIEPAHSTIDPAQVSRAITPKTKVIVPVHFAGHPCRMKQLRRAARGRIIIEDAAHALGAEYEGSRIGSCRYSDMTIFSFHPVKVITTGEGGAVTTNDKKLYERLLLFRSHGITRDPRLVKRSEGAWYYEMRELGFNYRLTDFQAALGIAQLKKLEGFIARRRKIAAWYIQLLSDAAGVTLPDEAGNVRSAWHLFYIRLANRRVRGRMFDFLRSRGIGVQVHYIPVHLQPFYRRLGFKKGDFPCAEEYYEHTLSLPLFPGLTRSDIERVAAAVKACDA